MNESDWNPCDPPNNQSICPNSRNMTSLLIYGKKELR